MPRFLASLICILLLAMASVATAAKRVLYLGDSMSMGAFGTTVDARLRQGGMEVYTSVTGGATPQFWLKEFPPYEADIGHWKKTSKEDQRFKTLPVTPKLETLLAEFKPDAVVVQTGTNLYAMLRSKDTTPAEAQTKVLSLMQKMATAVTSQGCALYWITPPRAHPDKYPAALQDLMLDLTKRAVAPFGRVFDSYAVTTWKAPYPAEGEDGIHYGPKDAAAWGEIVARDALTYLKAAQPPRAPKALPPPIAPRARIVPDDDATESDSTALTVEIRLVRRSEFTTPSEIPYKNATAVYEWEILRIIEGHHSSKRVLVAHQICKDRKLTSECDLKIGKTYIVQLVPMSTYPYMEVWDCIDKISDEYPKPITIYTPSRD